MVSRGSTLEWCVPCAPSCLKIYLCYKFFPLLNSSFTILFNYFSPSLCFLSAPNQQHSHFFLTQLYYKIPVHRERKSDNYYPLEHVSDTCPHFVFHSCNFVILSPLLLLTHSLLTSYICHSLHCVHSITSHCS